MSSNTKKIENLNKDIIANLLLRLACSRSEEELYNQACEVLEKVEESQWKQVLSVSTPSVALLYSLLVNDGTRNTNKKIIKYLKTLSLITVNKNNKIKEEVIKITEETTRNKCPVFFIKGASLLFNVYSEDIAMRNMNDIDILCSPKELEDVENILISLGYAEDYTSVLSKEKEKNRKYFKENHYHYIYTKNQIIVELHWGIDRNIKDKDFPSLFSENLFTGPRGIPIKIPTPEVQLIISILNFYHDTFLKIRKRWLKIVSEKQTVYVKTIKFILETKKLLWYYKKSINKEKLVLLIKTLPKNTAFLLILVFFNNMFPTNLFSEVLNEFSNDKILSLYKNQLLSLDKNDLYSQVSLLLVFIKLTEGLDFKPEIGFEHSKANWIELIVESFQNIKPK